MRRLRPRDGEGKEEREIPWPRAAEHRAVCRGEQEEERT